MFDYIRRKISASLRYVAGGKEDSKGKAGQDALCCIIFSFPVPLLVAHQRVYL
jgi:hypothetical protein